MLKGLCLKIMLNKSSQGASYSTCIIEALFRVYFVFCYWFFLLYSLVFWIHFFLEEYFLHCKATSAAPQSVWLRKHLFPSKIGRTRSMMHFYFQAMQYPYCFPSYYYLINHLHSKQRLFSVVQISVMVSRPLIFCWLGLGFQYFSRVWLSVGLW